MKVRQLRWRFYRKTGGPRGLGLRCKDYEPGCLICQAYRIKNERGWFPAFDELQAVCDAALGYGPEFSCVQPALAAIEGDE